MVQKVYAVERQKIISIKQKPPKLKSWSHDDDLKANKGKRIEVGAMSGEDASGVLIDSDRYTIQVMVHMGDGIQSLVTLYKHAISGYRFL